MALFLSRTQDPVVAAPPLGSAIDQTPWATAVNLDKLNKPMALRYLVAAEAWVSSRWIIPETLFHSDLAVRRSAAP